MANCEFRAACFFYDKKSEMPRTSRYINEKYCKGDFARCPIYRQAKFGGIGSYGVDEKSKPQQQKEKRNVIFMNHAADR